MTPSPEATLTGMERLALVTDALLAPYGEGITLGPNAADPEDPETLTIFAFIDEWSFDPETERYGWGGTPYGFVGAGATIERIASTDFDGFTLGSAPSCTALVDENLEIAALQEVAAAEVMGHPGKIFTEAYGDGFVLGACAELGGGATLLVRVPDPFYITTATGLSTPAARALRAALLAAADPFID